MLHGLRLFRSLVASSNEHDDKNVLIVVTGQNAYLFIGSITLYDEQ